MVVNDVGRDSADGHGGNDLKLRILCLDRLIELRVTPVVGLCFVKIILVADFHPRQGERRGVPVLRAHRAPLRVWSARHILNLIQRVLYVGFQVGARLDYLTTEGIAAIDGKKRLHPEVFAPLEELQQSHSVRRVITPGRRMRGTVDERANHLLPVEAGFNAVAFQIVAAGKAQERRTHGRQFFHDVGAVAVGAIAIRGREQRNQLEPKRRRPVQSQFEMIFRRRRNRSGPHTEPVFLPRGSRNRDRSFGKHLSGLIRHQRDLHWHGRLFIAFGKERSRVLRVRATRHAPIAFVENARGIAGIRFCNLELRAAGQRGRGPGPRIDTDFRG